MPGPYTLTIHIAEDGTPKLDQDRTDKNRMLWKGETSSAGHMWYSIRDGDGPAKSYGFAPQNDKNRPGSVTGKVYDTDSKKYYQPLYERTMEISEKQYNSLLEFGEAGLQNDWQLTVVWISPGMPSSTRSLSGMSRKRQLFAVVNYTYSRNTADRSGPIMKGI